MGTEDAGTLVLDEEVVGGASGLLTVVGDASVVVNPSVELVDSGMVVTFAASASESPLKRSNRIPTIRTIMPAATATFIASDAYQGFEFNSGTPSLSFGQER